MLLLPRKGVLAIAAVLDIALNARGRPVAAKSLAGRHRLPPRHLEPVLQALVHEGIFHGIRGPRGGYELARERRGGGARHGVSRVVSRNDAAQGHGNAGRDPGTVRTHASVAQGVCPWWDGMKDKRSFS